MFTNGSIHFVDFQKYVGFRAGKIEVSAFFQITLPVNYGYGEVMMTFDAQLKEIDCPTVLLNGYGDGYLRPRLRTLPEQNYGLFQIPSNAYSSDDRLSGVNGAIRYTRD